MAEFEEEDNTMDQTRTPDNGSAVEEEDVNDTTMDIDPRAGGFENQLAKKLVRYALSCEFARTPIRRQGIREKGELQPNLEAYLDKRRLTGASPWRASAGFQEGLCTRARAAAENLRNGDETAACPRKANTRGKAER